MTKITIPSPVFPGFSIIMSLSEEDVKKITSFFSNMPLGSKAAEMIEGLTASFDFKSATEIVKTITSFSSLLEEPNVNYEDLAINLSESYNALSGSVPADKLDVLKKNLLAIFKSSKNLNIVLKARDLLLENDNNFGDCRILTDVRLVFNEDLENKKRHSVIIHRLHIEYRKATRINDIYLALDIQDLKQLKEEIERAIKKEEVIKTDYSNSIEFI
jgi:hypothetical protein